MLSRRVKGWDLLVVANGSDNLRIIPIGTKVTPESLMEKAYQGSHHFIVNRNLDNLPNQLRGTLVCCSNKVGVVLLATGLYAVVCFVLPRKEKKTFQ